MRNIIIALALTFSSQAHAAEPAPESFTSREFCGIWFAVGYKVTCTVKDLTGFLERRGGEITWAKLSSEKWIMKLTTTDPVTDERIKLALTLFVNKGEKVEVESFYANGAKATAKDAKEFISAMVEGYRAETGQSKKARWTDAEMAGPFGEK